MKIIYPKYQVVKRQQERKLKFEIEKNQKELEEVILKFNDSLFTKFLVEPDYSSLYLRYLEQWIKTIGFMNKHKKFVYTKPNEAYFTECLKPLETPFEPSFMDRLFLRVLDYVWNTDISKDW